MFMFIILSFRIKEEESEEYYHFDQIACGSKLQLSTRITFHFGARVELECTSGVNECLVFKGINLKCFDTLN